MPYNGSDLIAHVQLQLAQTAVTVRSWPLPQLLKPSQEAAAVGHSGISAATVFSVKADTCTSTQTHYTNNYTASQIPAKAAATHNSLPHNSYISKRGCFC